MIPHTVPNNPMYGVMDAVVARNATRCSSLAISVVDARSSARSTPSRLLNVGRDGSLSRPVFTGRSHLRREFCVRGIEEPDQ
jgi:hypothetical protein